MTGQHLGHLVRVVVGLPADEALEEGLLETLLVEDEVAASLLVHLPQLAEGGEVRAAACNHSTLLELDVCVNCGCVTVCLFGVLERDRERGEGEVEREEK